VEDSSNNDSNHQLRVLVSAPYMQNKILDRFRPFFASQNIEIVVPPVRERLEESDLMTWAMDVDGVICGDDRFTPKVVEAAAPRLKIISKWGTGIDSIHKGACAKHNVVIGNTPDAFSHPVSDSALAYILSFARRVPDATEQMRQGLWEKLPGRALNESTLGVIGVGCVGKAVTRRAVAFGMKVIGYDIAEIDPAFIKETNMTVVSTKEELLKAVDFVSLNCDLNETSHHIMNDETFKCMQPHAVLINTARGPLVDEAALVRALESETIAGAGLDVFEHEPLSVDSPLRRMPQVFMAPHNSNSSPMAWEKVHLNTINNLIKVFQKEFPSRSFDLITTDTCPKSAEDAVVDKSKGKRVVLITGSCGGIGRATARVFAHAGWYVIGVDRMNCSTTETCIHRFIEEDISQPEAADRILKQVEEHEGRLHALVNNAAAQICKPIQDTTVEEWDMIMNTNVRHAFLTSKAFYPLLKQTKGSIINVSSVHAVGTSRDIAAYATSKGAVLAMTRATALDFGPDEIRVNCVLPGAVDTGMLRHGLSRGHVDADASTDNKVRALGKKHVMGRVGRPEEIGQAILFLADGMRSSFMTGQSIVVDGGATCRLSTE